MEEEKYTSIQSYVSSLKSLVASQKIAMEGRDWTDKKKKSGSKKSYYGSEVKIVENAILHAKAITDIAVENKSTESKSFQTWIKKFLSFYTLHEKRVDEYMKKNKLEDLVDNEGFQAELKFQQEITSGRSGFKAKYDKLKKNIDEVRKDEVALKWRGNAFAPITMKGIVYEKHPEIEEFMERKL